MTAEMSSSQPNPSRLFAALSGYQLTLAIKSGVELDVFTHIADGANTVREIARRTDASEKGIRILCDFLTIHGVLTKEGPTYGLASDAQVFLSKRSPAYLGSIALFLAHPSQIKNYLDLTTSVRKGGTAHDGNLEPENPLWVDFARYMAPLAAVGGMALARVVATPGAPQKVLDIAAGSGGYGIAIAKLNPAAEIYAQDWKNVLEVSLEGARAAGVADRYHTIPGSAFDVELGSGYDLVLVPNFLHHFDMAVNTGLLARLRRAMTPGGTIGIVEFVPNEDRVSPPIAASFSLQMLGATDSGEAYTFRDLDAMLAAAGFSNRRAQALAPTPQTLVTAEA